MEESNKYVPGANRKTRIYRAEIPSEMADKAILRINEAMDKYTIEKDMATFVKKKCDEEFGGTWHCVIGRNFGCSITHDTKFVLFVQLDLMHALIFKSHE